MGVVRLQSDLPEIAHLEDSGTVLYVSHFIDATKTITLLFRLALS